MERRLKYSPSKMATALQMVKTGAMSQRKAAITYGVPRATLFDKLAGRSPEERRRPGPATVLTPAEEEVLVDYVKLMSSIGYPMSRGELLEEVKKVIDIDGRETPFKNNKPGKDWFYAFKRRHTDLRERFAMNLGHQRAMVNMDMVNSWYAGLFKYLQEEVPDYKTMISDPRRVFNADESGFPLCFKTGKVLATRGARHVYHVSTSNKQQITVMVSFNAFGDFVPPLIVYPGERFRDTGISNFPEAIYGHSSNGWMDSDLFVAFLHEFSNFVDKKCIQKPVLLFVDGHSTHMTRNASLFCSEHGIILYCFLPNATHILQPCDVALFSPMKSAWKKHVKLWQIDNIGENLTKRDFPKVFKATWESVTCLEIAVRGFRRSGIFPLDPSGVDQTKLEPSSVANPPTATVQDLAVDNQQNAQDVDVSQAIPPTATLQKTSVMPQENQQTPQRTEQIPPTPTPPSLATRQPLSELPTDASATMNTEEVSRGPQAKVISPVASTSKQSPSYVSPAFQNLKVPEPKIKKRGQSLNQKLPKALSGSVALKMFEDRENQKVAEMLRKQKRKIDLEMKRKEKEEHANKRKLEREEKKKAREEEKLSKQKQKRQRKLSGSSSSSDEGNVKVVYMESDDSFNEIDTCPGCHTDDASDDPFEWIKCRKCRRSWHVSCTGESILVEIPVEQLKEYPFHCENCL